MLPEPMRRAVPDQLTSGLWCRLELVRKVVVPEPRVAAKAREAVRLKEVAALGAAGTRPVVRLGTGGQVRFLVQPQYAPVTVEGTCVAIRVDRLDACTPPPVEFVVRDMDHGLEQP